MTIIRDGKEIELTWQELMDAYNELDKNYKIEDIKSQIEQMEVDNIEEGDIENIFTMFEHTLTNNDSYWDDYWRTMEYAIEEYSRRKVGVN